METHRGATDLVGSTVKWGTNMTFVILPTYEWIILLCIYYEFRTMLPLIALVLGLTISDVQSRAQTLDSSGILSSLGITPNTNCICTPFFKCFDEGSGSLLRNHPVITVRQANDPSPCADILDLCCRNLVNPASVMTPNTNPSQPQPPPFPPPITSQIQGSLQPISAVTSMPSPLVTSRPAPFPTINRGCGIRNSDGVGFTFSGFDEGQAQYGEFPWMVALLTTNTGFGADMGARNLFLGGGSLIAPNVVLTAAHKPNDNEIGKTIMVRVGEWNFREANEPTPHQDIPVKEIIYHPRFSRKSLYYNYALLVLERPAQLGETVGTICLPSNSGQRYTGQQCILSGWGQNVHGEQGRYQRILKLVSANMVEHSQCQRVMQTEGPKFGLQSNFILNESFVCAGDQGQDACTGDGGSPLVCLDPTSPGRYVQVGISSWGLGCGQPGIPGVYANVALVTPWIQEKMNEIAAGGFNVRDG